MTANFQADPKTNLDQLLELQPGRPTMVMEFWSGWFDHWFEEHHEIPLDGKTTEISLSVVIRQIIPRFLDFATWLEGIFTHSNTSVNFYMFHGGTNFGFMAGANSMVEPPYYAPDVTSYGKEAFIRPQLTKFYTVLFQ